jgi:16S rRNA (guanine966-N2)-methyltransferase
MRVIAGSAKGHHLKPPASQATRPTADKIKGALFAMLESLCGLEDMRVLDLYAGTGALAIEALSRGAAWADLVEQHKPTCAIIRQNLEHTRCADRAAIHPMSVRASFTAPYFTEGLPYDIILLDPPYADPTIGQVMETLAATNMVGENTVVVLEHARRFAVQPSYGRLRLVKTRYHGDTGLSIYTAAGDSGIASEDDASPEQATGSEGNGLEDSDLPG